MSLSAPALLRPEGWRPIALLIELAVSSPRAHRGASGETPRSTSRRQVDSRNMTHTIQIVLTMLRAGEWAPVTAARGLIGIFFCISGGTKLFTPAQFGVLEQTLVQSHIPFPHANALLVS